MSGVGKTTGARAAARHYDLWLYSLDSRTYAHAERLPEDSRTLDELWIERSPKQMADEFEAEAALRFPLVLEDLAAIPEDGAPVLVDGPQLVPSLVQEPALFLVASADLQRQLVAARGSFTYARTRDPDRAFANRVRRDELLASRIREIAVEIRSVGETGPLVDAFVRRHTKEWLSRSDRGDVSSRRRAENDRRLDQWRRYAAVEPRAREVSLDWPASAIVPDAPSS